MYSSPDSEIFGDGFGDDYADFSPYVDPYIPIEQEKMGRDWDENEFDSSDPDRIKVYNYRDIYNEKSAPYYLDNSDTVREYLFSNVPSYHATEPYANKGESERGNKGGNGNGEKNGGRGEREGGSENVLIIFFILLFILVIISYSVYKMSSKLNKLQNILKEMSARVN
jgi:hypothetical protein